MRKARSNPALAGVDYTAMLQPYQTHRLVARKYFYILPAPLLRDLVQSFGKNAFDSGEMLKLDRELSDISAAGGGFVGLFNGGPLEFRWLSDQDSYASHSLAS